MIDQIADTKKPVIISCGMTNIKEIQLSQPHLGNEEVERIKEVIDSAVKRLKLNRNV